MLDATETDALPKKLFVVLDAIPGEFSSTNKKHNDKIKRVANPWNICFGATLEDEDGDDLFLLLCVNGRVSQLASVS